MSKQEGLRVVLTDPDELRVMLRARTHWFVVFGRTALPLIDELDKALDIWPTFPTTIGPPCMTVIPKDRVSRRRMLQAIEKAGGVKIGEGRLEQDLFMLAEPEEMIGIGETLAILAGPDQPC